MIISIDPITGKSIDKTCKNLIRESHWLHRYECPGHWHGEGASVMGLKRSVHHSALLAVLHGLTPDGKVRLADNALQAARHCGWLLNFQSPRTVNMLHAVSPAGYAHKIEKGHEKAVKAGLDELETRIKARAGVSMVFARFQHRIGDGQTPNLHSLVAAANLGFLPNGHVQTFTPEAMEMSRKSMEWTYRTIYVHELEKGLGLQVKAEAHNFEIVGVPEHASRTFAQAFGTNCGRGSELIESWRNLSKISHSELRERWNDFANKAGWNSEQAKDLVDYGRTHHTQTDKETKSKSHGHSY